MNGGISPLSNGPVPEMHREFEALVREHQSYVYGMIYRRLNNREIAAELTQEVFLKAFRGLAGYDRRLPFRPWIAKIAKNHLCTYLGRKFIRTEPLPAGPPGTRGMRPHDARAAGDPVPEAYERAELAALVAAALSRMPDGLGELFFMRYYKELTYEEIADRLGLPTGTAKAQVSRGMKRLRGILSRAPGHSRPGRRLVAASAG